MFLKIASECLLPLATTSKVHCAEACDGFHGQRAPCAVVFAHADGEQPASVPGRGCRGRDPIAHWHL